MLQTLSRWLPVHAPFDWGPLLDHLAFRAIPGVEAVRDGVWHRSVRLPEGTPAVVSVAETTDGVTGGTALRMDLSVLPGTLPEEAAVSWVEQAVARIFDTATDPNVYRQVLGQDEHLKGLMEQWPGVRIPGLWDPFEAAMRAMLGQQVTVRAARTFAGRLVDRCGEDLPDLLRRDGVTRLFPEPAAVAAADLAAFGMPGRRVASLQALAARVAETADCLARAGTLDATEKALCALPGIGPWTAQYLCLRFYRFTDAFPAADIGLLRAMETDGQRPTPAALARRAEQWRPWRGYAAQLLWVSDAGSL